MMRVLFLLVTILAAVSPVSSAAHALDPGYLELASLGENRWRVTWRAPDVNGRPMPINAILPENCSHESLPPPVFDGGAWTTGWMTTCPEGLANGIIEIRGLEATNTDTLVRYELEPGRTQVYLLTANETAFTVPADPSALGIMTSYVTLGVTHILEGVDHLLFVFALLLLVRGRRRLVWAITAFTVAHSISLGAATLGWLHVPSPPVEAVIALSIVFLAYELTIAPQKRDPITQRFPWVVSFAFGLIHGLGFAGALREIGLPEADISLALFAFNIGVEIGQLLFIAAILALGKVSLQLYPKLKLHGSTLTLMSSYAIGSVATFWVIERVSGF